MVREKIYYMYCTKSVQHAYNSHVSSSTNPCVNKAIHVLLMQGFGTLNILVLGHYILQKMMCLSLLYTAWPWNMNISENLKPSVDRETATKYSVLLFLHFGE